MISWKSQLAVTSPAKPPKNMQSFFTLLITVKRFQEIKKSFVSESEET